MKGLIIDEPWISLILGGEKTWEMRSRHTEVRGRIALIRKGSGTVVGIADLTDSIGPLDPIAWRAHRERHRIPLERQAEVGKWNTAWLLENVRRLARPVPYAHPSGAVIWVNLDDEVCSAMELASVLAPVPPRNLPGGPTLKRTRTQPIAEHRFKPSPSELVPVARDGSWFSPDLSRAGGYTIGAKGEEEVVRNYPDALARLRIMQVPRWRRPNARGNWGIVTGLHWESVARLVR